MADNKQIKDGVGNLFSVRMRDRSVAQDGSQMQSWIQSTLIPIEYGAGGCYQVEARTPSTPMAAGLAAAAPIFAFQNPGANLALVRRVRLNVFSQDVAFVPGLASFHLWTARAFTAQYGGGAIRNLTKPFAQLRTTMAGSQASITVSTGTALTGGTLTFDPDPLDGRSMGAPTTTNTPFTPTPMTLLDKLQGEHPLALAQYEGFVIRANVPATGTWGFAVATEWDEVTLF